MAFANHDRQQCHCLFREVLMHHAAADLRAQHCYKCILDLICATVDKL